MIPVTVSNTYIKIGDPNWGQDEFFDDTLKYSKNDDDEYKPEGEHTKKIYDREILELFFLQHNLEPSYPKNVKVRK